MEPTERDLARAARVRELFDQLVDLPAGQRASLLHRECGSDAELRRSVEALLQGSGPEAFLEPEPARAFQLGERVGPYVLRRQLGEGGMGVVHEAEDPQSGVRVALKTVRIPRAWQLDGLRREIQALRRLRHPGVVRVVDDGVERGVPWYAMELVEGPSLRTFLSGAQPAPGFGHLSEALALVRALCETLAYLHGEGIVHRDLKPDNVLLGEGGPVLVDFGLAAAFPAEARELLDGDGEALGTLGYLAPEQARREPVDARADLYAVGAILYEILTGAPPCATQGELAHSRLPEGIPDRLERLVTALLADDPRDRIGHADVVASELLAVGAGGVRGASPRARAYLYKAGLVGRREQLDLLVAQLTGSARGGVVTIGGEAGVGKTYFANALSGRLRRHRLRVVAGAGRPASEGAGALEAFLPLGRAIADHCLEAGPSEVDAILGGRGSRLARHLPPLAQIPNVSAASADVEPPSRPRQRELFADLLETMLAFAEARPLVLLIDDLHLADERSREFLAFAAPRLRGTSVAIVATHLVDDPLVERLAGARRLVLSRLAAADVAGIATGMMAAEVPADLAGLLFETSGGNPFFVAEYLRLAISEGLVLRDGQGRWQVAGDVASWRTLPVPGSLADLLARRLAALPSGARELTKAAAVIGRRLAPSLLSRIGTMDAAAFREALRDLEIRDVLVPAGEGDVAFAHVQLRDVAYASLDGEACRALHARVAGLLEEEERRDEGALADHWDAAGEAARARPHHLAAARHALALFLHGEAERHYRAYLGTTAPPDPESVAARNDLAEWVLGMTGRYDEALAEHERALSEAHALGDQRLVGETLRSLGAVHRTAGRLVEAQRAYHEALLVHRRRGERGRELAAIANLANVHRAQGHLGKARALCLEALTLGRPEDAPGETARIYSLLAALFYEEGRVDRAAEMGARSLAAHRLAGNRRAEAAVTGNLGLLRQRQGRRDEAAELFAQALETYRQVGDRHGQALVETNLAALLLETGRPGEAERSAERALELCRSIDDVQGQAAAREQLAAVAAGRGEVEAGLALLEAALVVHRSAGARKEEGGALAAMADLESRRPSGEAAAASLGAEAERILREVGAPLELARCLCIRGQVALRAGRDGGRFLAAAREIAERLPAAGQGPLAASLAELAAAQRAFEVHGDAP